MRASCVHHFSTEPNVFQMCQLMHVHRTHTETASNAHIEIGFDLGRFVCGIFAAWRAVRGQQCGETERTNRFANRGVIRYVNLSVQRARIPHITYALSPRIYIGLAAMRRAFFPFFRSSRRCEFSFYSFVCCCCIFAVGVVWCLVCLCAYFFGSAFFHIQIYISLLCRTFTSRCV